MASAHLGGLLGYSSVKSIVSLKRPPSQIVFALPGITHSHAMMFCEPSALLRGFATKPYGWSLLQVLRSSCSRPRAMPAIVCSSAR